MYEVYRYIFVGGLVLCIVMLIVTVLLFFLLKIKAAMGDITGANKRKAIENIHNKSASTSAEKKPTKFDYENQTTSAKLKAESVETTKISPQDRYDNMEASETTVLNAIDGSDTTVLSADDLSQTTVLSGSRQQEEPKHNEQFKVLIDITYVHSNEVIR